MMKQQLLLFLVLLATSLTLYATQTAPPELLITPGEESYTITAIGQGEIHITCRYFDLITGDEAWTEEVQSPYAITRTDRPIIIELEAYAQVAGEQRSNTVRYQMIIPHLGVEIPPAPQITVQQKTDEWRGDYYIVSAVGQEMTHLFKKDARGNWEESTSSDENGNPCFEIIPAYNEDQQLVFKAYQDQWAEYVNSAEDIYRMFNVSGPTVYYEYVIEGTKYLDGQIIFGDVGIDGVLSVNYIGAGAEDVTLSATINGNPVDVIDGKIQLVPGHNLVHVEASAEGYINSPIEEWTEVEWIAPTHEPQIIVTPGDLAYTVQAVGEGEIHLYCDHGCQFHQFEGEMENPFTISRTNYDETITCYATASLGDGYEPSIVYLDVEVPALGQTPAPQITVTEDETGCVVRAIGQGEVHLYNYRQEEVENPYRILRPYVPDYENYYSNPYFIFYAKAKAEGQWESELVEKYIEVTPAPWIEMNENPMYCSDIEMPEDALPVEYTFYVYGNGDLQLYMNGEEVSNPFTISNLQITEVSTFTAKAKESGALTNYSEQSIEIQPLPKKSNLVTISYDDQNCYLTAQGEGYITVFAYHYDPRFDVYGSASDEGVGKVVVSIPRIGVEEWKYRVECRNGQDGELLSYDVGNFTVPSNLLMGHPWIHVSKELVESYEVSVHPWIIYGDDMPSTDGVKVDYGTVLLLDGEVVESPYVIERPEYGESPKSYHFTAKNTLELQRYSFEGLWVGENGELIPTYSIEPIETLQMSGEVAELTVNVPAERSPRDGDGFDFKWDNNVCEYLVHCINNGNPYTYYGWTANYAVVGDNREKNFAQEYNSGTCNIPATISAYYEDIEYRDGRLKYQAVESDPSFLRITWMEWGGDYPDGGPVTLASGTCPVTAIADSAFMDNQTLTKVEIGKNVKEIGKDAFKGCSNLTTVICQSMTPPTMTNEETFDEHCYNNATLLVPESALEEYKTADWWRKFKHINGIETPGIPGDINGDGEVGLSDVNELIDNILSSNNYDDVLDINGDGEINISDINALISIILAGS